MILVLVGAASYGMLSPLTKLAYGGGWSASQISAAQLTLGAVLMWLLAAGRPKRWMNPFRGPWIRLSLIGLIGISSTTVLINMALSEMKASLVIVLLFQFTWISLLMELVIDRRRPTAHEIVSVVLVLAGTVLTVDLLHAGAEAGASVKGVGCGLLAAVTYSLFIVMTGRVRTKLDYVIKSAVMLTSALPLIVLLYPIADLVAPESAALVGWGVLLGLLGQVIPTAAFNWGIPKIGGALAAVLGSIELPVAVIGAFFIVHEMIVWPQWVGIGLILAGIAAAQKRSGSS